MDFIAKPARHSTEEEVDLTEDISLKLKSGAKPKLENIKPAQWVAANALILADIITTDQLEVPLHTLVLDYMSYTVKIGHLANRYTWQSVILFDDEYRDLQAQNHFRWGCDSSHLSTVALVERLKDDNSGFLSSKKQSRSKKSKSKSERREPCVVLQ